MNALPASRVNYYNRQYLRLAELTDEQAYHVQLRRRHNLSHHSWGIVCGLEVVTQQDGRPAVQPGLAIDGYGRDLLLLDREVYGQDVFDRFATTRLDLWLEYQLEESGAPLGSVDCSGGDPRGAYRAVETAVIVAVRAGAPPDPTHPPDVPSTALEEPLLDTPDDPEKLWPVYLGRIIMDATSATPTFTIDTSDRVYVGLNAELVDHPGNATRLELGRRPTQDDTRQVGDDTYKYAGDSRRDFGVFIPASGSDPLKPTIGVSAEATTIRGNTEIHGNLILDGASLQFPDPLSSPPDTQNQPALYRMQTPSGDELRLDVGSIDTGSRKFVLGTTQNGQFAAALEVTFSFTGGGDPAVSVLVHGDLEVDGTILSEDIRTRTVTPDVAALLTGLVQSVVSGP